MLLPSFRNTRLEFEPTSACAACPFWDCHIITGPFRLGNLKPTPKAVLQATGLQRPDLRADSQNSPSIGRRPKSLDPTTQATTAQTRGDALCCAVSTRQNTLDPPLKGLGCHLSSCPLSPLHLHHESPIGRQTLLSHPSWRPTRETWLRIRGWTRVC